MYKLGIDIGSTTIKMALIKVGSQESKVESPKAVVLATDYRRHNAEPMKVGKEMIEGILRAIKDQQSAVGNQQSAVGEQRSSISIGADLLLKVYACLCAMHFSICPPV